MTALQDKGRAFHALHHAGEPFVLANPWDAGSARLFERAGMVALGTTSAGYAFSIGTTDNKIGRDAILENAKTIADATDLPVSADLENGFGADPTTVAETIRLAGQFGIVGGSIEDCTYNNEEPLFALRHATERMQAAADAARALPFKFTLTGRAENFLVGRADLKDTIARLQAYQEAGADVLYAPGLTKLDDMRSVLASVDLPVNIVVGLSAAMPNVAMFKELGVARLSIGSGLARLAYGQAVRAAEAINERGDFSSLEEAMPYGDISERLA